MDNINIVRRVFVEKREQFAVEATGLLKDLRNNLGISHLRSVRIFNRYDISGISNEDYARAVSLVLSEPQVDNVFHEELSNIKSDWLLAIESLPGQFNQRSDSAAQCIQILTCGNRPICATARIIALYGSLTESDKSQIADYLVNPVESRIASLEKLDTLSQEMPVPEDVKSVVGFIELSQVSLEQLSADYGFAMSYADLKFIQDYFISEKRDPTITELRVLDTYWSDHCRHTTFLTSITDVNIGTTSSVGRVIRATYDDYLEARKELYGDLQSIRPVTLMDLATLAMKRLKKSGYLADLDQSEEINACSIRVPVKTDLGIEEYLVMFKNETHNHPTEIEPFGGAATCLGGAIRDPLSGRSYVYQAMRVTGSGDPTVSVSDTLPGKLSQLKITTGAATGYSSYGNQIGIATGMVDEIYHPGYIAKRMEIGAVIAAAPSRNVVREVPKPGDSIILLGGRTGRDGCGGATGSSKEHDEESLISCGAEVQKGNPPTERKIQRLFRNPDASRLIKRCNDFGAGGVCVAIGELSDGLDINLDAISKKYDGLDGTELAISESQERMAVVVSPSDEDEFLRLAQSENLEAVKVAVVTSNRRMKMFWRGEIIVDISRDFLDTNGALQYADIKIIPPDIADNYFNRLPDYYNKDDFTGTLRKALNSLASCSRKGLAEKFDSTIGAGTVLMPFGGIKQLSPESGMVATIPTDRGVSSTSTLMTYGFDPNLSTWSPFHGAYYAVLESLSRITAMGGDASIARLTFQEYFERLGNVKEKWGKPFSALLGAYKAQMDFKTPAIGGKDSMSGTFKELNVPPTLVSFAVSVSDAGKTVSATFQKVSGVVVCLPVSTDINGLPIIDSVKNQYKAIMSYNNAGLLLAASTVKSGGIAVSTAQMTFGNNVGFTFVESLFPEEMFLPSIGAIIAQLDISAKDIINNPIFAELNLKNEIFILGSTTLLDDICFADQSVKIDYLLESWSSKLENVFPTKARSEIINKSVASGSIKTYINRYTGIAKPRVVIPVFPGTNCEYDSAKAFEKAGATVETIIFNNIRPNDVGDSIERLQKAICTSNIIMIPGGFSGGDEPDGSGKFIATAFRNPFIAEGITKLLEVRDGLILGICNGFQALIKLGLLPYGKISDVFSDSATLTFNSIGRHVSCYTQTKVVNNESPWLSKTGINEIFTIPVSHGEGRFIAPDSLIKQLFANGQIATQYVDYDGIPSGEIPYNPNGSMYAIEGITSPDGRIFGKMGHSERKGINVGVNVPGNKDQKLFEAGVFYFK